MAAIFRQICTYYLACHVSVPIKQNDKIVMTFNDRLSKIHTVEDAEDQIRLAKNYVRRIRREAKACETLEAKLEKEALRKEADLVLRHLRRHIFDIEDALRAGLPATSVLQN